MTNGTTFLQAGCISRRQTNRLKALMAYKQIDKCVKKQHQAIGMQMMIDEIHQLHTLQIVLNQTVSNCITRHRFVLIYKAH